MPGESAPQVKILDFGVAKVQFQKSKEKLTHTGIIVGTPAYLAPEQISPQGKSSPASDIYALGVLLFQCLTGELPIQANSAVGFLLKVLQDSPVSLGELRPELAGSELEVLLHQMLAKEASARPPSTMALWEALETAVEPLGELLDRAASAPVIAASTPQRSTPRASTMRESFTYNSSDGGLLTSTLQMPSSASFAEAETSPMSQVVRGALLPQGRGQESGERKPWLWLGLSVLAVVVVGALWFRLVDSPPGKHPTPQPRRQAQRPRVAVRDPLDGLVIQGRRAFDQRRYLEAVRLWKQAMRRPGWRNSRYYPRLYRAMGRAFSEKGRLHGAVHYYLKYKRVVRKEQARIRALQRELREKQLPPARREQLDHALQRLLARLPRVSQVEKDLRALEKLQSLLQPT